MIVYRYAEGPPWRVAGTSYTRSSACSSPGPSNPRSAPGASSRRFPFQVYALHIYKGVKHEPHRWHRTLYTREIYMRICLILPVMVLLAARVPADTLCHPLLSSLPSSPHHLNVPRFAKPTGRLASSAPLQSVLCVGRAMLDWCRCVCKRAGQHQCFESSVRPHYFTPGLGTAIPHRLACSPGITPAPPHPRAGGAAGISSLHPLLRSLSLHLLLGRSLTRLFACSLTRADPDAHDRYLLIWASVYR